MTTYRWVPVGDKVLIRCHCGGEYEHLRVVPDRSPTYLREIYLCKECKGLFGFPRRGRS